MNRCPQFIGKRKSKSLVGCPTPPMALKGNPGTCSSPPGTLPKPSGQLLKPSNKGKSKLKVIYEQNSLENVSPNPSWADQHFPWLSEAILPPAQAIPAPFPKPSRHSPKPLLHPSGAFSEGHALPPLPALLVASLSNTQAATSQHSPASGHQPTF